MKYWAYGPYVREMNLWERNVAKISIVAPLNYREELPIDLSYNSENIKFYKVPAFAFLGFKDKLYAMCVLPIIVYKMLIAMYRADHIHLRCPGNMGLLGCFLQVFFPNKRKSAKYAGNWDWNSKQPLSYRIQQRILRNTFFTRNMQVLVYGNWYETSNIRPFFTASYSDGEITPLLPRELFKRQRLKLLFVGTLNDGKRPRLSLEVAHKLLKDGIDCELFFYGSGPELENLKDYCVKYDIQRSVFFQGNVGASEVKRAYQESHFLIFASKSEGWPKAVAESMFWGCLPITTAVSCVPEMVGNNLRGDLVEPNVSDIISRIEYYLINPREYQTRCENAMSWSRQFTLEKLDEEIKKLLL